MLLNGVGYCKRKCNVVHRSSIFTNGSLIRVFGYYEVSMALFGEMLLSRETFIALRNSGW